MPELPEVETVVRSLRPRLLGQTLTQTWTGPLALRQPIDHRASRLAIDPVALSTLHGASFQQIDRVGKYLLFHFSNGRVLVSHLGMTGRYLVVAQKAPIEPHTHLRFRLASSAPGPARSPAEELRYVDPRRFGLAVLREAGHLPEIERLGPDPLGPAFTIEHLHAAMQSRRDLKSLLLDQERVAGLGNIYVAEALFLAGLRPNRPGDRLTRPAAARLHAAIVDTLTAAIARRGTTLSDGGYIDAEGQSGDNQHHLKVYSRDGQPCHTCGVTIRRIVQAQRSSFYCPTCQR